MPYKIISKEEKDNIVDYYKSIPMTIDDCSNHFNLCKPTIAKILDEYNVERYRKTQVYNPYLKEDFFRYIEGFQDEFKAYFLGLLITDGNVFAPSDSYNREYTISITLQEEDEYILQTFLDVLNSNTVVGHDGRGCAQACVRSSIMANDLAKYGICPNKTLYTRLPMFTNPLIMSCLIRGIIDGDGSIGYGLTSEKKYYHSISFSGTKELMEDIRDYLYNTLQLTYVSVYTYKDRHLSEIKYQSLTDIQRLGNWIYPYPMHICMYRKYNKFLDLKRFFGLY